MLPKPLLFFYNVAIVFRYQNIILEKIVEETKNTEVPIVMCYAFLM